MNQKNLQDLTTPLTPARPQALSASAESDQARAVAEVQAQMVIAKRYPRDEIAARDKIINACTRKGLAEVAMYSYSRGGTDITGPSIRLAEVLVTAWGNILPGWRELSRQSGVSEVEAYAWDLESNTRWALTFQVRHWRDTKQGGKPVTEERDIYELMANMASRRVRACILKLIPGDIIDDAVAQCDATLRSTANVTPEHIKRMVEALAQYGITPEMIEAKIQRRLESITAPQVVQLGKIFNSLKDGMSKPEDWFDTSLAKKEVVKPESKEGKPEAAKAGVKDAKAKDKPKPEPQKGKPEDAFDPETGEVAARVAEQNRAAASAPNPNLDFGE